MPADEDAAGIDATGTNYATPVVQSMDYTQTSATVGEIKISVNAIGGDMAAGDSFTMTGTGTGSGVEWVCATVDVEEKYLPASCR